MVMVHQQALEQEHSERAPRTADELSKVCNIKELNPDRYSNHFSLLSGV
jgi:hypothetical protein